MLQDRQRNFKKNRIGPRLTWQERFDLRLLRLLYSKPTQDPDPKPDQGPGGEEHCDHPFRHAQFAEDGNLYPPNSKLRPPKDGGIEEEFVELPPYCYPPRARLPPHKEEDILYVDAAGFRWSKKLIA